jgi:hypothetical protein
MSIRPLGEAVLRALRSSPAVPPARSADLAVHWAAVNAEEAALRSRLRRFGAETPPRAASPAPVVAPVAPAADPAIAERLVALEGVGQETLVLLRELVSEFKAMRELADRTAA